VGCGSFQQLAKGWLFEVFGPGDLRVAQGLAGTL
jgi:hypothetical protein